MPTPLPLRILCLHGRCQSGAIFANKIGGARRKLAKVYELDFVDALYPVDDDDNDNDNDEGEDTTATTGGGTKSRGGGSGGLGWWTRRSDGTHNMDQLHAAMDHVRSHIQRKKQQQQQQQQDPRDDYYDAVVGFSQGGLLATALVLSGDLGKVQAVITASSPYVPEVFHVAHERSIRKSHSRSSRTGTTATETTATGTTATPTTANSNRGEDDNDDTMRASPSRTATTTTTTTTIADSSSSPSFCCWEQGYAVPKLHFAGDADTMIPLHMVELLCQAGGNGHIIRHEKGHLFPTNALHVNAMMEFLKEHISICSSTERNE